MHIITFIISVAIVVKELVSLIYITANITAVVTANVRGSFDKYR